MVFQIGFFERTAHPRRAYKLEHINTWREVFKCQKKANTQSNTETRRPVEEIILLHKIQVCFANRIWACDTQTIQASDLIDKVFGWLTARFQALTPISSDVSNDDFKCCKVRSPILPTSLLVYKTHSPAWPADGSPVILIRCEPVRLQAEFWTVQGLTMCKSTPVLKCLAAEGEREREGEGGKERAAQITGSLAQSQQTHKCSHVLQHNNKAHYSSVNRQSVLPWTFSLITVTAV